LVKRRTKRKGLPGCNNLHHRVTSRGCVLRPQAAARSLHWSITTQMPRRPDMTHSRRTVISLFAVTLAALPAALCAQGVFAEDGVAIRGYDPVAYFTEGRPRRGDPAFAADWQGARWLFASAANRDRFLADPEGHAPQFGGYCAWAVAEGYTAPIDPNAWRIVDGKLYLNYSRRIQNRWERDIPRNIARAIANWPALRG
jgi:hypothetical protein